MEEMSSEDKNKKFSFKEIIKSIDRIVTGDVLANLAYASMMMLYFLFFNILYEAVSEDILIQYINISSMAFLIISILIIEIENKNEDDNMLIYGLEFLVLSIFILLIKHIPKLLTLNTQTYILIGSYIFALYYMLKSTILYTKEKQQELKNYSDIKEIVKDEPIKKATKRKNKKIE